MNIIKTVQSSFWNQGFWLPKNYSWNEIYAYNNCNSTNLIFTPTLIALILYFIRTYFER